MHGVEGEILHMEERVVINPPRFSTVPLLCNGDVLFSLLYMNMEVLY